MGFQNQYIIWNHSGVLRVVVVVQFAVASTSMKVTTQLYSIVIIGSLFVAV
jgi:hypothetical protein